MKTYIKIALIFVVFIAFAGILAGLYLYNLKSPDLARVRPDYVLTASALQKAFENNEDSASARYTKKVLEVTGNIASIKTGENNVISISLATESDLSSVICTFASLKDPSVLKPGEEITVRGKCSGFLMDVLLNNCALIREKKKD